MKNIKYLYILFFSLICISCKQKEKNANYTGELKIYADTNLAYLLEQFVPVFQNIYPAIEIKFIYKYEEELLKDYFNNISDNIILSRRLTDNEIAYADQHKKSNSSQFTFAYDAIATFTTISSKETAVDLKQLHQYSIAFDNPNSGIIKTIVADSIQKVAAHLADNSKGVQKWVKSSGSIGFIQFSEISNRNDPSNKLFYKNFKLLNIKINNQTFELNQENIFQDKYPLKRQLTIISTQSMTSKQRLFSRFLFKERASKIIMHHGIVPAKIPAVEINIIDKNFEVEE